MRLLQTKTLELVDAEALQWPPYAILSHRWGDQEVTLQHVRLTTPDGLRPPHVSYMEGYQKIRQFYYLAAHEGFEYGWVETCCINNIDPIIMPHVMDLGRLLQPKVIGVEVRDSEHVL